MLRDFGKDECGGFTENHWERMLSVDIIKLEKKAYPMDFPQNSGDYKIFEQIAVVIQAEYRTRNLKSVLCH